MRITNLQGRAAVVSADGSAVDVATASDGRFGPDPQSLYDQWDDFRQWAAAHDTDGGQPLDPRRIGPVVPRPRQVFAIGLNYKAHAAESGFDLPIEPVVFTKFASSLTGPAGDIELSPGNVDWEVELVVVIGREGRHLAAADAWDHVAGLTVGQDISDRTTQFIAPPAQFGLGKSYASYSPIGPVLVTPDEFDDPDDIEIGCRVNGSVMQQGRTNDLVFPVPDLIARLSAIVALLPGDLIFTGTPAGVGVGRTPPVFLSPGDELVTWAQGIGQMTHRFVPSTTPTTQQ